MSVVLPAPLGPMTAVSRPEGSVRFTPSTAASAPKRFERPSVLRSSVVTGSPTGKDARDAAPEAHDQGHHDRPEPDEPVLREADDDVLEHEEEEGAHDGAAEDVDPPQERGQDRLGRGAPMGDGRGHGVLQRGE